MAWWAWYLIGISTGASWPWWATSFFALSDRRFLKKHPDAELANEPGWRTSF